MLLGVVAVWSGRDANMTATVETDASSGLTVNEETGELLHGHFFQSDPK